jgi:hypothetical protein
MRTSLTQPVIPVVCQKCGAKAMGIPYKIHRRCGGSKGAPIRPKTDKICKADRGIWSTPLPAEQE